MPTDKPLPDTDEDIIDLTDLVEEGGAGGGTPGDDGPVDMSFEQELDDLFGDVEAGPAASAAAPASAGEAPIDLAGLELGDMDDAEAGAEAIDLANLGVEEVEAGAPADAGTPSPAAVDDELADLFDGFEAASPAPEPSTIDMDFSDLAEEAPAPEARAAQAAEPVREAPASEVPLAEEAVDLSEVELAGLVAEAAPQAPAAVVDDLLGELPAGDEALDVSGLSEISVLEEGGAPQAPAASPVAAAAAVAAGAAAVTAMAAAGKAGPGVGGVDLDALDQLIDTAKGPLPEPEAPEAGVPSEALAALRDRMDALEAANAALAGKCAALPPAPDEDALATALAGRLEEALAGRFEALLAARMPDIDAVKAELRADIETARPDHEGLLRDFKAALAPEFDALRQELPDTADLAGKSEMADALEGLRQAVGRLETLGQDRQAQFDDFAAALETRLADLRRELPGPEAFVTPKKLGEALAEMCDTVSAEVSAALEKRLDAVADAARLAAREEVAALGEALSGRLDALEAERTDPDALAKKVCDILAPTMPDIESRLQAKLGRDDLDASLAALRADMASEMERAVPRAAAAVIREEIAALAKEFL